MEEEKLECQIIILLIANNKIIESINDESFNSSMICLIISTPAIDLATPWIASSLTDLEYPWIILGLADAIS